MALGFGANVARLSATLTLDDDGFMKGMAEASTKLDAYNAKLKEEGVGRRFATMASRDYAKQLYEEARGVDQATQSHGRLITTLQSARQHWKLLGVATVGAGVGIMALTGHIGTLTGLLGQLGGAALPAVNTALSGILTPFTSLAAIVVGLVAPLSALVTLLGAVGVGAGFGLYSALTSNNKAFNDLQNRVKNMMGMFHDLGVTLGQRFLPYINAGVTTIESFIKYADKLAHMSLPQVIQSISTQGMRMLEKVNRSIYDLIGKPLMQIFSASFGGAGNRISGAFAKMLDVWKPLVGRMWGVFTSWFDRQHFTAVGAQWAGAIVNTALPVILKALLNGLKATFGSVGVWGKVGMIAGAAFAANFLSGGFVARIGAALGRSIFGGLGAGLLGRGAAGAAGGAEGVAGGAAAAGGGGGVVGLLGAAGIAAIVGVAVPAALVYLSSRQSASSQNKFGAGPGITPRGPGSPGFLPSDLRTEAAKDAAALNKVAAAEKNLNQFIADGGKSVKGWKIAMGQATDQATKAQGAIHDLGSKGIISADDAAQRSKANLQNFINQEDAIARKATTASQNTAKFGASTRAQYAHVAALARTSAQLAAAIDSIPSSKYVSLVVSITENLKTEGLNPGNTRTQQGLPSASGGLVSGGTPNRDSVPILAMPGEVVLSKPAVAALGGPAYANSLNMGAPLLRMAAGGVVPPRIPTSVLNAPSRFKNPSWYRSDRQLAPRLRAAEKALRRAEHMPNPSGSSKADLDARNARAKAIAAAKAHLHQVKFRMANNSPRLAQWLSNRVGAIDSTMQFNEQTWDTQFQNTGDPSWFNKEQAQRLQEVALYKHAAAYAAAHHLNATPYREASITAWQAYQSAAGQSGGAGGGGMSAAEIASFLSTQQGFLSEFAGNIILPGAAAVLTGGTSGGGGGSSGGGGSRGLTVPNRTLKPGSGVTIHNHFTSTPPDTFVHIRKAKLQAEAVWGS